MFTKFFCGAKLKSALDRYNAKNEYEREIFKLSLSRFVGVYDGGCYLQETWKSENRFYKLNKIKEVC